MVDVKLRGLARGLVLSPLLAALAACNGDPAGSTGTDSATATQGTTAGTDAGTDGTSTASTGNLPTTGTDPTTGSTATTAGPTTDSTTTDGTTSTTGNTTGGAEEGGLTKRPSLPIVLVGGQLPGLSGVAAGDIVAFAAQDGQWSQIAVQVDERLRGDFCQVYAEELLGMNAPCKTAQTIEALFYADPNTYTGADPDVGLDLDDEVAFMARDAGDRVAPGDEPAGVVAGSGVEVELTDGDEKGWVYLYQREDPMLDPGAGVDLVSYDLVFNPEIDYKTEYPFVGKGSCGDAVCDPPILEESIIKSENYERHFSARWVTDSLKITRPGSTGEDLIDIAQSRFAPNICGRHVLTFSTSEGAFVTNIDGPVRAIRSYLGANSGPLTQRTHMFYDGMEVIQTFLRVHAVGAIMELIDYSSDADGMTYYNEYNEGGLGIDGVPDPGFDDTAFTWELVSGPHGSVVSVLDPRLSQPLMTTAYYEDDANTPNNQCSASNVLDHPDDEARGQSGMWIVEAIPDTDPRNGSQEYVFIQRTSYYEAPDLSLDEAKQLVALAKAPPTAVARAAAGSPCGDATCDNGEEASCPYDCNPFDQTCGDGLCDPWENSVSCEADCSTGMGMGNMGCGNGMCEVGEHELNCAADCWTGMFEPLVACMQQDCAMQVGACSDEQACVDRVVCVAECVAMGGNANTCTTTCNMQIPATMEQAAFEAALLTCTQANCV